MSTLNIKSLDNKDIGKMTLPIQFNEDIRPDLIARAVHAIQSHNRQPYGIKKDAGMQHSAEISRRRRDYKASYGKGISRVQRKILSRRGTQFNWVGANTSDAVGGRRVHSPKANKQWSQKINIQERHKAIRSALAATVNKTLVIARGHHVPETYPFIIDKTLEALTTTKSVQDALAILGFANDLERSATRKVRAGQGKRRGRKHKQAKSLLIVVSHTCNAQKAARNIPGINITTINDVNAEILAPGAHPGRATLYTSAAIEKLTKEKLFINKRTL